MLAEEERMRSLRMGRKRSELASLVDCEVIRRMAGIGVDRKTLNHADIFSKRAVDGLRLSVSEEQRCCIES